jgi:PAS domain S-box-containing protein
MIAHRGLRELRMEVRTVQPALPVELRIVRAGPTKGAGTGRAAARPIRAAPPAPELSRNRSDVSTDLSSHPGLEALADGFCMVDPAYRVTYWNAAAERLFGVPRREALGRAVWDVIGVEGERELRARLAEVEEGEPPLRLTLVSSLELLPRHLSVRASQLAEGGIALHFQDITDEQRLTARHSQLLESIRDGFVGVDADWCITYVNRAAQVLLSLRRERALGLDLRELLPAEPAYLRVAVEGTMRDREPRHLEAVRPEGRVFGGRCFDVWLHGLPDGGVSLLFQDVTERMEHEITLAQLAAEAEEASRAKSRFFAAVSHELRTPLHAIVGYTHLLGTATYGEMPEAAVRAAERATVCAEHLAQLIDDVLLLTTTEVSRLRVSPVEVVLENYLPTALEPLRQQAEAKGLEFALSLPADLPPVTADPERLRQLVVALVTNAVKFTSRGGVRVEARVVEDGAGPLMEIAVVDTGPGINPRDRDRIFEAFEQIGDEARTNSLARGTGLGLTVARQLAELMGGSLRVEGASTRGSTFLLRLPIG